MQLQTLTKQSIATALAKAERYRFLADPSATESICLDILAVEPGHQQALITLILALTDQFKDPTHHVSLQAPLKRLKDLTSEYQQIYYRGIACERWAKAQLLRGAHGAGPIAYEFLREAMSWYDKAAPLAEADNCEVMLRRNSCIRCIEDHKLTAPDHSNDGSGHWHE